MTSDEAKQLAEEIRPRWRELYSADKCQKGITCPLCGSGQGPNGTGITENPRASRPGMLRCWHEGCSFNSGGDVLQLIQLERNVGFIDAVGIAADRLGLLPSASAPECRTSLSGQAEKRPHSEAKDYTEQYKVWSDNLQEPGNPGAVYLASRGISAETAQRTGVGFAPDWVSPTSAARGYKGPGSPRIIFPKGAGAYAARDIRPQDTVPAQAARYMKQNEGRGGLFHASVLMEPGDDPVVVAEGPMDALSAEEAGIPALALCGTSGIGTLAGFLKQHETSHPLIIALDNDEAGRDAAAKLTVKLDDLNVPYILCPEKMYGQAKDLNAALCKDRERFLAELRAFVSSAMQMILEDRKAEQAAYEAAIFAAGRLDGYKERIAKNCSVATGYADLDTLLDGGLYPGLYILGAISSLGKTTFALQMMDQIAAAGRDVLVFSMEMGADELIAKSISRLSYTLSKNSDTYSGMALTTREVLNGEQDSSEARQQLFEAAMKEYREGSAVRFGIIEGNGDIGARQIQEMTAKHIRMTGRKPVVLIDYLQIVPPAEPRATDKQNTDRAVFDLKAMSREFGLPVVAISSFNRDNYTAPVSFASFKESGAIEYSSDVLMGMQYAGMDRAAEGNNSSRSKQAQDLYKENMEKVAAGSPIGIELKVLKNRSGRKGQVSFLFRPQFNMFESDSECIHEALPAEFDDGFEDFLIQP